MSTHGKSQVFKLSGVDASLTDISSVIDGAIGFEVKVEHPEDSVLGDNAERHRTTGRIEAPISVKGQLRQITSSVIPIHGKVTRLYFNQYGLTPTSNSDFPIMKGGIKRSVEVPNTECLGDAYMKHGVIGREKASGSFDGYFVSGAGKIADVFEANAVADPPTPIIHTVAYAGDTVGNLADLVQIITGSVKTGTDKKSVAPISCSWDNDDVLDTGVSLHSNDTQETTTFDGTGVDEKAATTGGWVAHLHVTAIVGTSFTLKLQDSADNITYADLTGGSFGAVTAVGGTRLTGAVGSTVRQYVRVICSATSSPTSINFSCFLARRTYVNATMAPAGTHRAFAQLLTIATAPTFEYYPVGTTAGNKKYSGSCRMSSYNTTYDAKSITGFDLQLVSDGTVTIGTA